MTKKMSGFIALTLVALLVAFLVFIGRIIILDRDSDAFEVLGGTFAPPLFAALISLIIGFVGGAIRIGAFKSTFYWCYVVLLTLFTIGNIAILSSYFNY